MRCKSVTAISILMLLSAFSVGFAADPDASGSIVDKDVVFEEVGGVVAVEAEHFYKQTLNEVRSWYLFTPKQQPKLEGLEDHRFFFADQQDRLCQRAFAGKELPETVG